MRFVTFQTDGGEPRFGTLLDDGRIAELAGDALSFIQGGAPALDEARRVLADPGTVFDPSEVRLLAPLANPGKVIAAGKNFSDHAAEMRSGGTGPRQPVAFAQFASAIIGPDDAIPYPPQTEKLDYEVEVAVIIGAPAQDVTPEEACAHVFGYTVFNDISARDLYRTEGETGIGLLGKNLPAFAPLGPCIVTADEVPDIQNARLRSRVNGEIRQDSTLANMIFSIDELIAHWSAIGLQPGDILTSGTPSGVAAGRKPDQSPWWLTPGDTVEVEVEGIGTLRNAIAD